MRRDLLAVLLLLVGGNANAAPFRNSLVSGAPAYGTLTFSGATATNKILFPDNLAAALTIGETGLGNYISFTSTNGAEKILTSVAVTIGGGNTLTLSDDLTFSANSRHINIPDNTTWGIREGTNQYLTLATTNGAELVTINKNMGFDSSTWALNAALTITASGLVSNFIVDNLANSYIFREGGNTYLQFVTTNGLEKLVTERPWQFDLITSLSGAGTTQGAATVLAHQYNVCTTATTGSADAFVLRAATAGLTMSLKNNSSAATIQLFPASGAQVCVSGSACAASNASVTIATNVQLDCIAESTTKWNCR